MASKTFNKFPILSSSLLTKKDLFYKEIIKRHEEACQRGEFTYIDPKTGNSVFTVFYHLKRGSCCGNGCRHCPFI